jgi:hypothetical protein
VVIAEVLCSRAFDASCCSHESIGSLFTSRCTAANELPDLAVKSELRDAKYFGFPDHTALACKTSRSPAAYSLPTPNGVKVSIMLEEIRLPYEVHLVDFNKGEQQSPEFISLNPNGTFPSSRSRRGKVRIVSINRKTRLAVFIGAAGWRVNRVRSS